MKFTNVLFGLLVVCGCMSFQGCGSSDSTTAIEPVQEPSVNNTDYEAQMQKSTNAMKNKK